MFQVCNLSQSALEGQIQAGEKKLAMPEHKDNEKLKAHVEECKSEWLSREANGKISKPAVVESVEQVPAEPVVPSDEGQAPQEV